jgi:hypothetical protein
VLNALQTFQTHKLNQESGTSAVAMVSTSNKKFPVKVIPLCGFGEHNPKATSHNEPCCFEKYPHLKKTQQQRGEPKNASASFAHASAFASFRTSGDWNTFVINSATSHHMLCDKSMLTNFASEVTPIKTGSSSDKLQALGSGSALVMIGSKTLVLNNCLYVPKISQQLISLVRLIQSSITISIVGSQFTIRKD